ncbi:MAG TPA: hypothetical protein VGZ22_20335, partial [Isosphaeraceae bacterium]|nr:hypothetical protein [Isosphaeraceae bacterium]
MAQTAREPSSDISGTKQFRAPVPTIGNQAEVTGRHESLDAKSGLLNSFRRLVQIMRSNERLFEELQSQGARLNRARAYLTEFGSNSTLGVVNLNHA